MTFGNVQRRHTLRFPAQPHLRLDPGCVVSYCPVASSIGTRVLYNGGNAVDAAVATGLALAVTYPQAGNLGGGGFMMISAGDGVHMLDYRETAPSAVDASMYDDEGSDTSKSVLGALAVGVPGTVAGLAEAHTRFGRMPWHEIVAQVVPLAYEGVWLSTRQAAAMRLYHDTLKQFESTSRYFLEAGAALLPGTLFRQRDLARTLESIADSGAAAFYRGWIADRIVAQVTTLGGVLCHEDLAVYRPHWRTPLRRSFYGNDVYLPSLPSAGGMVTAFALSAAQALELESLKYGTPQWVINWSRVFRTAFAIGNRFAGDPEVVAPADLALAHELCERELDRSGLEKIEAEFRVREPIGDAAAARRLSTTHYSVMDRDGMAVSNTYSINTLFGSKLVVDGAGFFLNNTMADFRIGSGPNWYGLLQGDNNRLAGKRRPASSMAPAIVVQEGRVTMAIGGSGGPRIPTSVAQVISAVFAEGVALSDAVSRRRVHHQLFPDDLVIEKGFQTSTIDRLSKDGHPIFVVSSLSTVAAIRRRLEDDEIAAVLDQRFGDFW